MFVLVFCLVIGFMLVAPAMGMGIVPGQGNTAVAEEYVKTPPQFAVKSTPATKNDLLNTPNPGGIHVEVVSSNYIVVHPLPKPVVGSQSNSEANYVQWAIDNVDPGGTVLLSMKDVKGAYRFFDFGKNFIEVRRDVIIKGEKIGDTIADEWLPTLGTNAPFEIVEKGVKKVLLSDRAVIYGGGDLVGYVTGAIHMAAPNSLVVEGIRFENSGNAAVYISSCNNATIYDNVITNVKTRYLDLNGVHFGFGVRIGGEPFVLSDQILGDINIEANYLDLFGPVGGPLNFVTFTSGIAVSDIDSAPKIYIKGNTINNPGYAGIWLAGAPATEIWVDDINTIEQRPATLPSAFPWGIGIEASGHFERGTPIVHINENVLNNISTWGISLGGAQPGCEIIDNIIDIAGADNGIELWTHYAPSSGVVINNNTIAGQGSTALIFYPGSNNNTVNIYPGNLDALTVDSGFHAVLVPGTYSNIVNLNTSGYAVLDLALPPGTNTVIP
jgi:hypothetical protein